MLTRLSGAKLLTVNRDASGALVSLDAHPLLREYFAKHLREKQHEAWKAAHRRLYEHLTASTPDKEAPTLDDLQPLYQAVAHGCHAGMHQDACDKVYIGRILRGTGVQASYSITKLGAFGADLGAVACFFDAPWQRVSPKLAPEAQNWMINQAGFHLQALGRLAEAREPMRADLSVERQNWQNAAISAGNLSQLELTLGDVGAAIRDGERAVGYADRSRHGFQQVVSRAAYADSLHQGGRRAEAKACFAEAERMQARIQPKNPFLFSVQGFLYCELLLANAEWRRLFANTASLHSAESNTVRGPERGSGSRRTGRRDKLRDSGPLLDACRRVSRRARRALWIAKTLDAPLLTIALDHLTLAGAALYEAILLGTSLSGANIKEEVDFLRRAGSQDHLPRGLLTRALWRAASGDFEGARGPRRGS